MPKDRCDRVYLFVGGVGGGGVVITLRDLEPILWQFGGFSQTLIVGYVAVYG